MDARSVIASQGWGVLHVYYRLRDRSQPLDAAAATALIDAFETDRDYQCFAFSVLGQRADVGFFILGPDFARLAALQRGIEATPLGQQLVAVPELSFVSLTEASEYLVDDGSERVAAMREARMHPRGLPRRRLICFYPMSKRREAERNWYTLDFGERQRLMYGHGETGRRFAGRIAQLITAATGLSDWEWGVTLLADDPRALKDVVYEMRYDQVSSVYAEFGPFTVGLVAPLRDALIEAGVPAPAGDR